MSFFLGTGFYGDSGTPSVSWKYSEYSSGPVSTYTYTGVPLGTADARRYIVVAATTDVSTISGVTVGGVSATRLTGPSGLDFFILLVPTGTSETVTVTKGSATNAKVTATVWAVYDIRSALLRDSAASTASPGVLDLDVLNKGIVLAVSLNSVAGVTRTWTGVTQDYAQTATLNNVNRSVASVAATTAGTPRTVSVAYSGGGSGFVATAISLR